MANHQTYSSLLDFTFLNPAEKREWHKMAKGMKEPELVVFYPKSYGYDGDPIAIELIDRGEFGEPDGWFRCDAYSQAIYTIRENFYSNFYFPAHSNS